MENNTIPDPQADDAENRITEELFNLTEKYVEATQGQRFVNWLVDNLLMRLALAYASGYFISYVLLYTAPSFLEWLFEEGEDSGRLLLFSLIVGYFNYIIYYTFCEKLFKGYTLGKLLSGTRAIREDGNELTFKDAILRSLSRIVPFEVFSGLGIRPWHDSWTNTRVVKTR